MKEARSGHCHPALWQWTLTEDIVLKDKEGELVK